MYLKKTSYLLRHLKNLKLKTDALEIYFKTNWFVKADLTVVWQEELKVEGMVIRKPDPVIEDPNWFARFIRFYNEFSLYPSVDLT